MTLCDNMYFFFSNFYKAELYLEETMFFSKKVETPERVLGIDLGTTNSVTAILEGGKPVVIPNAEGDKTTPSVIAFEEGGNIIVGRNAKRQAVVNPLNTYFSVKRYMGRRNGDLVRGSGELPSGPDNNSTIEISKEYLSRSFRLVGEDGGVGTFYYRESSDITSGNLTAGFLQKSVLLHSPALGEGLRPEFIAAKLLQKLASDASSYIKENVVKAVITVPAYFDDVQRKATSAAGEIAGLDVVKIINEPSSAAFAYGFDKVLDERLLVFDLGGGTFDVSILEVSDRVFEVLATGGNSALGGDDFDQALVQYILSEFYKSGGQELTSQPNALQRVLEAAEVAKIKLSASNSTIINLPFLCSARAGIENDPTSIKLEITRELFEQLTGGLVKQCLDCVKEVLADAQLSTEDLSKNVLVGGSTRIPYIKSSLFDLLGKVASDSINPDEVVALGAALQGGLISGELDNLVLLDVLSLSLGVELEGGLMQNLVPRNTVVPVSRAQNFTTSVDNQPGVQVVVLQGERLMARDNKTLGVFELSVQRAKAGVPVIAVTFDISSDGVLSVTGVDTATNEERKISISLDNSLTPEQIAELVAKAEASSLSDQRRVEVAAVSVRLDKVKAQCINEYAEMYSQPPAGFVGIDDLYKLCRLAEDEAKNTKDDSSPFETISSLEKEVLKWEEHISSKNETNPDTAEGYIDPSSQHTDEFLG